MNEYPLYGALDIGSNAARILFANVIPLETELFVFKNSLLRLPLRLGQDVYDHGKLSPAKIQALIETVKIFDSLVKIYKPLDIALCATAAIREASNSAQVLGLLKAETGYIINVIDGIEEARIIKELYAQKGKPEEWKVMADMGGGSFEITVLSPKGDFVSRSFKIGAVRILTAGYPEQEVKLMLHWLDKHLPKNREKVFFIGTGGNMNTMKSTFISPSVDYILLDEMYDVLSKLKPLSVKHRISMFKLRPDRADVIVPAAEIFSQLMSHCNIDRVHVPGGGLSDGIVLELHKKHNKI
jgi:exopolyphosphatase / guanosine-5'-triphosphate,3'-diphosphate pyrophosphatase